MTPHERMECALNGGKPDRTPVVPKIWIDSACSVLGTDVLDSLTDPSKAMRTILDAGITCGMDGVRLFHFPPRRIVRRDDKAFEVDEQQREIGRIDLKGGLSTHIYNTAYFHRDDPRFMAYHHFWASSEPFINNLEDVKTICVPTQADLIEMGWRRVQKTIMDHYAGQTAFIGDCSSGTLAFLVAMRGMERAMFDLLEQPELVHGAMDKGIAIALEKAKFHADLGVRFLRLNDSAANMNVISPKLWKEFIQPHMRDFCSEIHRYSPGIKVYCHICGNVLPVVEDLKKTGIDCIAPLDPLGGPGPEEYRAAVGKKFPLMGGVNTLSFVLNTPDEVRYEATRCIDTAGAEGAFVLGSGCALPRNTRKATLQALREASEEYKLK
jgi:uroporphyrinogen-III decarboxylase